MPVVCMLWNPQRSEPARQQVGHHFGGEWSRVRDLRVEEVCNETFEWNFEILILAFDPFWWKACERLFCYLNTRIRQIRQHLRLLGHLVSLFCIRSHIATAILMFSPVARGKGGNTDLTYVSQMSRELVPVEALYCSIAICCFFSLHMFSSQKEKMR